MYCRVDELMDCDLECSHTQRERDGGAQETQGQGKKTHLGAAKSSALLPGLEETPKNKEVRQSESFTKHFNTKSRSNITSTLDVQQDSSAAAASSSLLHLFNIIISIAND